jgi:hypothetical protein
MKYNEPLLNEREKTHGDYVANATLSQRLKATIRNSVLVDLSKDQRESLDLICTKIGRICTGNPNEADHWKDIAGYAELICSRLRRGKQNVVGSSKREGIPHTTMPIDARFVYGATVIDEAAADNYQAFIDDMGAVDKPTEDNTAAHPNHSSTYDDRPPSTGEQARLAGHSWSHADGIAPSIEGPSPLPDLEGTRLHGPEKIRLR